MAKLPKEIKLTRHAQQRLEERKNSDISYNTKNLMRSSCKWYGKDDLIPESALYLHCLYVCRKSSQMGYITDGDIEVIYNKGTGVAITVMEVKEKFLPITQYIKPEILEEIEKRKVVRKMKKTEITTGECRDCGKTEIEIYTDGMYEGLCERCKLREQNSRYRGKEYIPYKYLPIEERRKIDARQNGQFKRRHGGEEELIDIPKPELPVVENYYQVKAEQNPSIAQVIEKPMPVTPKSNITNFDPLSDQVSFIRILRECGSTISEESLKETLDVLVVTDKLKDMFMTIAKGVNQDTILNLENLMNVAEKKLQYNWEYSGFQEVDDIKFKGFLVWRRVLKEAIFFWKKLYQTNTITEIKKALDAYTSDQNEKQLVSGDKGNIVQKKFQITTDSISTIFNTRRPFTRVFYAPSEDEAYKQFVKWMADRQLHEDKSKTTIVELKVEGEDGRDK